MKAKNSEGSSKFRAIGAASSMASIDPAVAEIVRALCADYARRENELMSGSLCKRVKMEYAYLNRRIYEAAYSIDPYRAHTLIKEIGSRTGYAKSEITDIGYSTYCAHKAAVVKAIAKNLMLSE